jgi:hypothetical protein
MAYCMVPHTARESETPLRGIIASFMLPANFLGNRHLPFLRPASAPNTQTQVNLFTHTCQIVGECAFVCIGILRWYHKKGRKKGK